MKYFVALLCLWVTVPVSAEEAGKGDFAFEQPSAEEMQEMQNRWMEAGKPGKWHKRLDFFVGKWNVTTKVWMMPGAQPMETEGIGESRWLIEDRWIITEQDGSFMGMPYKTVTMHGYDNFRKKFVASHVDNLSTALLTFEGTLDETGNTLIEFGKLDEPMTGEVEKQVMYITKIIDDDNYVIEVHDMTIGLKNTKVIEMAYARRK